jgi:hypothetical protein
MSDGHPFTDDAGELGRDVEHRVVLDIGVPAQPDVVVLIAPEHAEGPDARPLLDGDIPDDLGRRVHVGAGMDARAASRDDPHHGTATASFGVRARTAGTRWVRHTAPADRSLAIAAAS